MKIVGPLLCILVLYLLFRNDAALFTEITDGLAAWFTDHMLEGSRQ